MIALPSTLAGWATELTRLPTELALTLAPWLGRLALAVGPMAERRSVRDGEPDGFTGLARRGSYERLVASEWALAEVAPDEFVRRAAAGEHLFHELARRSHHGARRAVAIVSAGPGQLGAPRLAHLALLVVLMRRARLAGAGFAWGVLEDPARALIDGLDVDGVARLLAARTTRCDDGDVAAWTAALGADRGCEPWWIGGARELAAARTAHARTITIDELVDPTRRELALAVQHRGPPTHLRLGLPDDATCARLLRAPLGGTRGGGRTARTRGQARALLVHGRRLLLALDRDRVECWPLPNSPRDQLGRPRPWTVPAGYQLVALGAEQRTALAVIAPADARDVVEVATAGGLARVQVRLPPEVRRRGSRADLGACGLVDLGGVGRALVFQADRHLLIVDTFPGTQRSYQASARLLHAGAGHVVRASIEPHHVMWAACVGDQVELWRHDAAGGRQVASAPGADARFGYDPGRVGAWGPVAIVDRDDCVIVSDGMALRRWPNVGATVAAVGPRPLVREDARTLALRGGQHAIGREQTSAEIVDVAVGTAAPVIASLTRAGEVVVRNPSNGELLLRLLPGEDDPP